MSKTSSYNLRRNDNFEKRKVHSGYHDTESLSFLGPKIWDLVPVELKQSETLYSFKLKIRNWESSECPCRICKTYIQQVGFRKAVWSLMFIAIDIIISMIYVIDVIFSYY